MNTLTKTLLIVFVFVIYLFTFRTSYYNAEAQNTANLRKLDSMNKVCDTILNNLKQIHERRKNNN